MYELNALSKQQRLKRKSVDFLRHLNNTQTNSLVLRPSPVIVRWNSYQIEAKSFTVFTPSAGCSLWRYAQGYLMLFFEKHIEVIIEEDDAIYVFLKETYEFGNSLEEMCHEQN